MSVNPKAEPTRLGSVPGAPARMLPPERVLLYARVFGTRPERCLEIGTLRGGSAMIAVAAFDDIGRGRIVCIDPEPQIKPELWASIEHRATLLRGLSPAILKEAERVAGGKFGIALIDGDHRRDGVIADLVGVMEVLEENGYMLMHDAHHPEVSEGIDHMLGAHPETLVDCGMLSNPSSPDSNSETVEWAGIRVLRMTAAKVGDSSLPPISTEEIEAGRKVEQELDELKTSTSWRITAPLRAARAGLRRR